MQQLFAVLGPLAIALISLVGLIKVRGKFRIPAVFGIAYGGLRLFNNSVKGTASQGGLLFSPPGTMYGPRYLDIDTLANVLLVAIAITVVLAWNSRAREK